jgi:hypothetical protein
LKPTPFFDQFFKKIVPGGINAVVAGTGSGKTTNYLNKLIYYAIAQPDIRESSKKLKIGYDIIIGERDLNVGLQVVLGYLDGVFRDSGLLVYASNNNGIMRIQGKYTQTNFIVKTYRQDPRAWESVQNAYHILLDECYQAKRAHFDECLKRKSRHNATIHMIGTPKGTAWVEELLQKIEQGSVSGIVDTCTSYDNPYQSLDAIEYAKLTLPAATFEREFLANRNRFNGQTIDLRQTHIHNFIFERSEYDWVIGGVDWGYSHRGVIVVIGIRKNGDVDILDCVSKSGVVVSADEGQQSWVQIAIDLKAKWGIDRFFCGPDEPGSIKIFRNKELYAVAAENSIRDGVTALQILFHTDANGHTRIRILSDVVSPGNRDLIAGVRRAHWPDSGDEVPEKIDDDEFDALRYAVYSCVARHAIPMHRIKTLDDGKRM